MRCFALYMYAVNPMAYYAMRQAAYHRHMMLPYGMHWYAYRWVYPI